MNLIRLVDEAARANRWASRHPADKLVLSAAAVTAVMMSPSLVRSLVIVAACALLVRYAARGPVLVWGRLVAAPVGFVAVSVLPLIIWPLWAGTATPTGSLDRAAGLVAQCAATSSAVALLALSTPMAHLAYAAQKFGIPGALVEVALSTFRFVHLLDEAVRGLATGRLVRFSKRGALPAAKLAGLLSAALVVRTHHKVAGAQRGMAARGLAHLPVLVPATRPPSPWFTGRAIAVSLLLWWLLPGGSSVY
ncbi:MAG: hypothetical protein EXQ51_05215 [Acidobacteria bacterium]|nr:hypothetical protein [Acidobacteriota bacterium]